MVDESGVIAGRTTYGDLPPEVDPEKSSSVRLVDDQLVFIANFLEVPEETTTTTTMQPVQTTSTSTTSTTVTTAITLLPATTVVP